MAVLGSLMVHWLGLWLWILCQMEFLASSSELLKELESDRMKLALRFFFLSLEPQYRLCGDWDTETSLSKTSLSPNPGVSGVYKPGTGISHHQRMVLGCNHAMVASLVEWKVRISHIRNSRDQLEFTTWDFDRTRRNVEIASLLALFEWSWKTDHSWKSKVLQGIRFNYLLFNQATIQHITCRVAHVKYTQRWQKVKSDGLTLIHFSSCLR